MKLIIFAILAAAILSAAGFIISPGNAQSEKTAAPDSIPPGYRDWRLLSVAREEGKLDDLRAILGNDIAIDATRQGKRSFPDGAIIARLAWDFTPLAESARAFGQLQSHVAGSPKNGLQFMIKDSVKYAATGGWGFAQFENGEQSNDAVPKACFACHAIVRDRGFVFSRYAASASNGVHP